MVTVDNDGAARIVLEAPASELANAMRLATKTRVTIRVTIKSESEAE